MNNLDDILNDGTGFDDVKDQITFLAALSLGLALKSYFATYKFTDLDFFLFTADGKPVEVDKNKYKIGYIENYFETIIHFQHFAELVCKDFLRSDHPLLASDATHTPLVLYKLLHNQAITPDEQEKIRSLEFSDALERICQLANHNNNKDKKTHFAIFLEYRKALEKLNTLRNRLWHRGRFVLGYASFDIFIGKHILPFVEKIIDLTSLTKSALAWNHKNLACGVDPIKEIILELSNKDETYNRIKVALLKELGRAAYNNNSFLEEKYPGAKNYNVQLGQNFEEDAQLKVNSGIANKLMRCPVCGLKTLLGKYYKVECICCTFSIGLELGNPDQYGFSITERWFD